MNLEPFGYLFCGLVVGIILGFRRGLRWRSYTEQHP